MRGARSGMDDNPAGINRDLSTGGRGGFAGRGGYHQGGYRGNTHGTGGVLGRPDLTQGDHLVHHGGAPSVPFKPAPEFEMKGNDFPALPGLDEPQKVSEPSDGHGSKPWDSKG